MGPGRRHSVVTVVKRLCTDMFVETIMSRVSIELGIDPQKVMSSSRKRELVAARHISWRVLNTFFGYTVSRIARSLQMDHTSIMHGLKNAKQLCKGNSMYSRHWVKWLKDNNMKHEDLIALFNRAMVAQLYANDHRNGNDGQYRRNFNINTPNIERLSGMFEELQFNIDQLKKAVFNDGTPMSPDEQKAATIATAADVANMAMLICYDVGSLRPMPQDIPVIEKGLPIPALTS